MRDVEHAELLLRASRMLCGPGAPEVADELVQFASALLAGNVLAEPAPRGSKQGPSDEVVFPLPIFNVYKGKRVEAELLNRSGSTRMEKVIYQSPSPAAVKVTETQVNGWAWWKFIDPRTNEERPIDVLREPGQRQRRRRR